MRKNRFIPAVLAALAVASCAHARSGSQNDRPDWIDNPYKVCAKDEMCAVGVGSQLKMARADARSGIAKIFESRVQSSFSSTTASDNDAIAESVRDHLNVETDMLIDAVEIKETFETPTDYYALAVLNKNTAIEKTVRELQLLDSQMANLMRDTTPASAVKLEKTYFERVGINQRYIVLTGKSYPEEVTYDDVYKAKKSRVGARHIYLVTNAAPVLESAVKEVLTQNGYTFAKNRTQKTPAVRVKITPEQAHLNVAGFVKYVYHFTLSGPDKKGVEVELLSTSFDGSGRNEKQAAASVADDLKAYLSENILNLNF